MWTLGSDLRFALRRLLRTPGFTAVAVLSLGLGIGANSAIFAFVNAVLLRPLPAVEDSDRLVRLFATDEDRSSYNQVSYLDYRDLDRLNQVFDGMAGYTGLQVSLGHDEEAQMERVQLVTGEYFDVLGVDPALGRTFTPEEGDLDRSGPVAVLSHGFWQRQYGSDPQVVGKTLTINGQELTIVGVAPEGFQGLSARVSAQAWVPLNLRGRLIRGPLNDLFDDRGSGIVEVVGRLGEGQSVEQAEAALQGLATELERAHPVTNEDRTIAVVPARGATIEPDLRRKYALGGGLLLAVVGVVLLIACVNLAGLLLARSLDRSKEIALRLSVGAQRVHVIRILVAESLILSFLGGGFGLLLAWWSRDALWALRPPELSATLPIAIDARVLAFTLGLSVLTALTFGLIPAFQLSRPNLIAALKGGEAFGMWPAVASGARRLLVAFQVALSLVLVTGAVLFLRSLDNAERLDPGFSVDDQLVFAFDLGTLDYGEERGQLFYEEAVERIESLPEVESAAIAESLKLYPSALGYWLRPVLVEGAEQTSDRDVELIQSNTVGVGYFETLGMTLLRGRVFDPRDRAGRARVVVVNETMAERLWPEKSAVGERIVFKGEESSPLEVVGVVSNARYNTIGEAPKPYLYVPLRQEYTSPAFMHVRTRSDPEAVLPVVRKAMSDLDDDLGLGFQMTLREVFEQNLWAPRLGATLFLIFGVLALGLACLGIYGVVSYSLRQRRRELSVRLALGAERNDLLKLMLRQGLVLAGVGTVIGLGFALWAERLAQSYVFGLEGPDLGVLGGAVAVLFVMALLANLLAAHKVFFVKPQDVLLVD